MRTLTLGLLLGFGLLPAGSRLIADDKPNDVALGAKPPEGAVVLFDGKSADGWVKTDGKTPADWPVADGIMTVGHGSIMTARKLGDIQLHLEFNVPYMPDAHGQARGNSGVYLAGCYEVQILDSYGLKPKDNECAGVYTQATPRVNACKPPLQWQTYDITFHRARVEDGKVVKKARVTIIFNGVNVIDNAEVGTTPGGVGTGAGDEGPLMLQDQGNAVQFRNIWAKPL
jgi:Domain of Unknown Function (DUF1080)